MISNQRKITLTSLDMDWPPYPSIECFLWLNGLVRALIRNMIAREDATPCSAKCLCPNAPLLAFFLKLQTASRRWGICVSRVKIELPLETERSDRKVSEKIKRVIEGHTCTAC